ncbi:hypothetical protein [uncultured Methanobrevibacter sp.]|uniref:hypothetical protein n=1 Tax=uncultured Methanobrevibacter sp. TaxID=253161 RepID=UPI0025DFB6DF|nr:hypothetical protein [uncultured Methanobrevibacter sp.]
MKSKFNLFLAALLIFICCIGAASAADDINDDSLTIDDDAVVVEQVDDVDLQSAESDDTALEVNNEENENLRATSVTVTNWSQLAGNASSSGDKTINLASGVTYTPTSQIVFGNNAKIVGTSTSYISGSYSGIPFYNSNSNYHITFQNVNFKDISCTMLMQMLSSGTTVLDGCTFTNVNASSSGHNSVIYNNYGTMNITDCTFTNCRAAFGVVTNYNAASTTNVIMNVRGSTFENNYGYTEPGCINNCGQLYVWTSTFNNNHAVWWAGAIHTHTNAKSVIRTSSFNGNTAGWNGGALYTYSTLEVYNSNFTNNNCSTNNGGGAIGASNYFFASNAYNVTIKCCNFVNNHNLASNGNGGAIAAMNGGTLTVSCSNFTRNSADNGQAICGFNTNEYANISEGEAHLVITDNRFINHDIKTGTTVKLSGLYTFEDNTFINSPQIEYNDLNDYDTIIPQNMNNDLLGASFDEILGDSEIVINSDDYSSSKDFRKALTSLVSSATGNTTIIIKGKTKVDRFGQGNPIANVTIIIEDKENWIYDVTFKVQGQEANNRGNTYSWVNCTFTKAITLSDSNYKFVNCTFINAAIDFGQLRETSLKDHIDSVDVYNYAFENCEFVNYTQTAIVGHMFSNVAIINCDFNNVTADAIVSTNANRTDDSGRQAGVTIKDSTFKDVTVKGIVKAQDYSVEAVTTDNKYDFATQKTLASDDAVYVDVPVNATTLTVKVADIKEGEDFTIDVTLSNNLTTNVSVVINQKEYNVSVVNGTGSLKGTDKLAANTYNVEASYAGEYPYAASTNTTTFKVEKVIINTALTAPKVSATYNVAKNLVITLKDANGNVLVGKYVTVKVGTISKNIQTDKKGQVSVNVATLVPKSYTASISFAGDDDYNKASTTAKVVVSKATPKLTTKKLKTKVKVKTKKVTATLKDNKGKVLKNTKVTLKVKGKTYTAKTNKKGKATFKVTKLNKKGTFKGKVKFAGNKYFKAVSKTVKIVVKK